ncbi:MAG TPA: hypothetical protein VFE46_07835 [Pirellulales bacterium]|jgi:hypothetical protein|nr:hypothetical protein [Pirellulales bacterium]
MARRNEPDDDDDDEFDYSETLCPNCGCNAIEVLQHPTSGTWFGSGRARCMSCQIEFKLRVEMNNVDSPFAPLVSKSAFFQIHGRPYHSRLNTDQVGNIAGMAAQLAPESPGAFSGAISGMGQLMEDNPKLTTMGTAAYLQLIGKQSNVGFDAAAEKLIPTILQMKKDGGSFSDSAAVADAISSDPRFAGFRGQQKADQLSIEMSSKLAEFLPSHDTAITDDKGRVTRRVKGTGLGSVEERLEFIRNHPDQAAKFLGTAHFSEQTAGAAADLLNPSSQLTGLNRSNLAQLNAMRPEDVQSFIGRLDAPAVQQTAAMGRSVDQVTEASFAENTEPAAWARVRDAGLEIHNKQSWLARTRNDLIETGAGLMDFFHVGGGGNVNQSYLNLVNRKRGTLRAAITDGRATSGEATELRGLDRLERLLEQIIENTRPIRERSRGPIDPSGNHE